MEYKINWLKKLTKVPQGVTPNKANHEFQKLIAISPFVILAIVWLVNHFTGN